MKDPRPPPPASEDAKRKWRRPRSEEDKKASKNGEERLFFFKRPSKLFSLLRPEHRIRRAKGGGTTNNAAALSKGSFVQFQTPAACQKSIPLLRPPFGTGGVGGGLARSFFFITGANGAETIRGKGGIGKRFQVKE